MRFSLLKPSGKHGYVINFRDLKEKDVTISFLFLSPLVTACMEIIVSSFHTILVENLNTRVC